VDIINEALLADKKAPYLLVRRPRQPPGGTFALVPADQKLPPPIPLVSLEDLDKFGRTEIVCVVVLLRGGRSAEVIAAVRKLQSPWGSATTMGGGRRLTLTDTTAAVREIIKTLRAADELAADAGVIKLRLKIAEADVEQQRERVLWSERMVKKGFLPANQLKEELRLLGELETAHEEAEADAKTLPAEPKKSTESDRKPQK
jgi:hypothetical protein